MSRYREVGGRWRPVKGSKISKDGSANEARLGAEDGLTFRSDHMYISFQLIKVSSAHILECCFFSTSEEDSIWNPLNFTMKLSYRRGIDWSRNIGVRKANEKANGLGS